MLNASQVLLGASPASARFLDEIARYAPVSYPILLCGEPGTGKTLFARHLHHLSRRTGPFVKESAAAIPANLEHSHLAGHLRGSFTGATEHRTGLFEAAHLGTFFLDELGVASAKVQEVLLQLMDDGTLRRMGETRHRPVDVRIVAATNADLEGLVRAGQFRRDLRDRFGYLVVRVPTLAERPEDIMPLATHFIERESRHLGQPGIRTISSEVCDCFMVAAWPGNIRELESVCRYIVLHAPVGVPIGLNDLPADFLAPLGTVLRRKTDDRHACARAALERAGGNKAEAARLLGVSRQHFYRLLSVAGDAPVDMQHDDSPAPLALTL